MTVNDTNWGVYALVLPSLAGGRMVSGILFPPGGGNMRIHDTLNQCNASTGATYLMRCWIDGVALCSPTKLLKSPKLFRLLCIKVRISLIRKFRIKLGLKLKERNEHKLQLLRTGHSQQSNINSSALKWQLNAQKQMKKEV